jgi:hypothetical protein
MVSTFTFLFISCECIRISKSSFLSLGSLWSFTELSVHGESFGARPQDKSVQDESGPPA